MIHSKIRKMHILAITKTKCNLASSQKNMLYISKNGYNLVRDLLVVRACEVGGLTFALSSRLTPS